MVAEYSFLLPSHPRKCHHLSCASALQVILPQLSLKWPNDIYAASQKIAGVLCTSTYRDKRFNVVVGE